MIDISKLKIGQKVHYKPAHYKEGEFENGLIKEISEWSLDSIRVVYNCAGNWKEYKNYTSALTNIVDLHLGWNGDNDRGWKADFDWMQLKELEYKIRHR